MDQKQGQKPRRIALCRACSFSASSIFPLRLRDHRRAAPAPQIQTNSSGSYRRSNKCRTFTFSSEGSATESPPPLPPVLPPASPASSCSYSRRSSLHCFSTMSLFLLSSVLRFLPSRVFPLMDRSPFGNEGAHVCITYIMYDGAVHS